MKKVIEFLKKQPLLAAVINAAICVGSIEFLSGDNEFGDALIRIVLAMTSCVFLYLISGTKTFDACEKTTGYVMKRLSGYLIYSFLLTAGMAALSVWGNNFVGGGLLQLQDNIPLKLILSAFLCLFIGLFEELCFRAVINDGIVYQFRNSKGVFAASAFISSLFFGWVHVMGADVSEPLLFAQAAIKTLSTALFGFAFLMLYWKTRNIWACGLAHGLYDFLAGIMSCVIVTEEQTGDTYVRTGKQGVAGLVSISLNLILGVIFVIHIWRKVGKTIDFEEMRKNW